VTDKVLPGDLVPGDVITVPDAKRAVVVRFVRLGRGGFIVTVAPVGSADDQDVRPVTLTTWTYVLWHGRSPGPGY
jgi:hypothetical protein